MESLRPPEFWRELFAKPPLDRYTVITDAAALPQIEMNYVWWGRKP
jgi:hypothetical protein